MGTDRAGGDSTPRAGEGGAYRKTPTQLATDPAFTGTYAPIASPAFTGTPTVNGNQFVVVVPPLGTGASDSANIQAALDSANAAGGGTVRLAGSTYRIGATLTVYSNVRLLGAGRRSTLLKSLSGTNLDAVIKSYQFDSLTGGNTSGGVSHVGISDLTIDANKQGNPSGGAGIKHYGAMPVFERITVRYAKTDNILSEWSNSAVVEDGCEGVLDSVVAHEADGSGIAWAGPHDSMWTNCIAFSNGAKGFWIKPGAAITVAHGCHAWGTSHTYAWCLESTAMLTGCQGEGASVAQLLVGANDCTITNSKFFGFTGTSVGVQIGDATHATISGTRLEGHIYNCPGGHLDITNSGGAGRIDVQIFGTGTGLVGSRKTNESENIRIAGGASGSGGLSLPDGTTIYGASNALNIIGSVSVFNVNAASKRIEVPNAADFIVYSDVFSTRVFQVLGGSGHILSGGGTPTVAALAAAGTGATVSITGNDTAGTVTLTTGTTPASGAQFTLTFAVAFSTTAPRSVRFTAESGSGALLAPYTASRTTTAVQLGLANTPSASTSYTFNYLVLG